MREGVKDNYCRTREEGIEKDVEDRMEEDGGERGCKEIDQTEA